MKLRDYQIECLETIKNSDKQFNLVMSSVGSGKTVIFSKLASDVTGRVLILVPSTELREQSIEKLEAIDKVNTIGSVQGNLDEVDAKIVVATRQSLIRGSRIHRMLEHGEFEYLVVDECHQAPKSIKKIIKLLNKDVKVVGFTATPYTKECIKIFGEPIFRRTMIDMIEQDYLIEPRAILVESKTDLRNVRTQNGDFIVSDLEVAVNNVERNLLALESYKNYAQDRVSTLIFATGVDHAKSIYELFKSEGINIGYVDGNTDKEERKTIIEKFKKLEIKVLVNVLALTTGFDAVAVDTLILLRPTRSRILYEQVLGRGLRLSPETNKKDCLVIDIQDVTRHHDLMDLSVIFNVNMKSGETPRQAKKRVTEEERIEKERQQQELLRKQEEERKRKEQLELRAREIKIFNKEMNNTFKGATYDWFKVDNMTWALKVDVNKAFVIEQDDTYKCYGVNLDKENKSAKFLFENESLIDLINSIERKYVRPTNQAASKNAKWKMDKPTEAQLKYCSWAVNRWQVDCYFSSNTIKSIMKKLVHSS